MSLFIAIAVGFTFALLFPSLSITNFPGYEILLYSLLAVGLYGSVHGIDLKEFHAHKAIIIRAVTVGVLVKSVIIGGIFWLIFQTPYAFLFGIVLAQIDPLSVAHLMDNKSHKFSSAGQTILRAWSSFDDPMTVLLALYVFLPLVITNTSEFTPDSYAIQFLGNILFVIVLYLLQKKISANNKRVTLLLVALLIAIPFKFMLGIAVIGLFLRPKLRYLSQAVQLAFFFSAAILGTLLTIESTVIIYGLVLGILAYTAQMIVTPLVAPHVNSTDKLLLACAQYNGITAIILALLLAKWIPEIVSIIAVSVITINLLYVSCNYFLVKRLQNA